MAISRKYLDPKVIARLRGLELRARAAVSGAVSGKHRSIYRGYSVEFAEHRPYVPGDDIRHIDWRLFGRKDRFFIKQYEEETNLRLNVLLDISKSMKYGTGRESKFTFGCFLAASIAYQVISQHDYVGLVTFDDDVRTKLPPKTGQPQLASFLNVLDGTQPTGRTMVRGLLDRLSEELRRRSLVVLISDLQTEVDDVIHGIEHLAHTGHEVILFHVMHHDEWEFPFVDLTRFEGLETDQFLLTDPQSLRNSYRAAVRRFSSKVHAACLKQRADYIRVNTRTPLEVVLAGYLSRRVGIAPREIADVESEAS
ncbi:MAG: DUF58 domain-containing protein [Phycisphaerae bacterium]